MKKLSFILAALLMLIVSVSPAYAAATPTFTVTSAEAHPGDTITLNVNVSNNPGVIMIGLGITYDANVLELKSAAPKDYKGVEFGPTTKQPFVITWDDSLNPNNNTTNGTLATLTFAVKSSAPVGETAVSVSYDEDNVFNAKYDNVAFSTVAGKLTVTCKTHTYGKWTKTSDTQHSHTCSVCGKVETAAHRWDAGKVTKAATCKETGVKTYTCSDCGATKTETIAKTTNHKFGAWTVTKAATCKETGIRTRTCTVCGQTEQETIPLSGHTFGAWTVEKAATCEEGGTEKRVCSVCGQTETRNIPALGHSWGRWTQTKAPTETETGEETRTCRNDETHVQTRTVPVLTPEAPAVRIVEGEDVTIEQGDDLSFVLDADVPEDITVTVDGQKLNEGEYAVDGSKITVNAGYINGLGAGKHSVEISSGDSKAEASFELTAKPTEPPTTAPETTSEPAVTVPESTVPAETDAPATSTEAPTSASSPASTAESGEGSPVGLIVGIAAAVIAAIAAVIVIVTKKKRDR